MGIYSVLLIFLIRNYGFQALGKFTARQHNESMATQTLEANIGPKTQYFPFMTATGVRFAQSHNIVHL
jgi:hypothetical protein